MEKEYSDKIQGEYYENLGEFNDFIKEIKPEDYIIYINKLYYIPTKNTPKFYNGVKVDFNKLLNLEIYAKIDEDEK